MGKILSFKKINKRFGDILALNDVSFDVSPNSIHGILGPNGSGKSTFMRILSGLIKTYNGSIFLDGVEISKASNKYLKSFGFMIEEPSFYEFLSAEENLKIFCRMLDYNFKAIEETLHRVDLIDWSKIKVENFSYGMKQRLGIAQAILHDPDILILDEPNNGLDPKGISEMNKLIESLQREGKTICISTHILKDVEQLCDSVTVLKKGKLILNASMEELVEKNNLINIKSKKIKLVEECLTSKGYSIVRKSDKTIVVKTDNKIQEVCSIIPTHIPIYSITKDSGLTDIFL